MSRGWLAGHVMGSDGLVIIAGLSILKRCPWMGLWMCLL